MSLPDAVKLGTLHPAVRSMIPRLGDCDRQKGQPDCRRWDGQHPVVEYLAKRELSASPMKIRFLGTGNARILPVFGSDSPFHLLFASAQVYRSQSAVLLETQQGIFCSMLARQMWVISLIIIVYRVSALAISTVIMCWAGLIKWGKGKRVRTLYPEGAQIMLIFSRIQGFYSEAAAFQQYNWVHFR